MRLIDADALKVAVKKELLMESGVSQMVWSNDVLDVIDEAVEVAAIPVEWLVSKMNMANDCRDIEMAEVISWLIQPWKKKQEAR